MPDIGGWISRLVCAKSGSKEKCEKTCGLCGNWFMLLLFNMVGLGMIWCLYFTQNKTGSPSASSGACWITIDSLSFLGNAKFDFVALLTIISTSLISSPLIRFIHDGWHTRREEILNRLTGEALKKYLIQYWERLATMATAIEVVDGKKTLNNDDVAERLFEKIYNEHYGKSAFWIPNTLLVIIVFIEAALIGLGETKVINIPSMLPLCLAALAGAYMFVVSDLVLMVRRRALNITDVYWYALRMLLAVPIAMSVNAISGSSTNSASGFSFAVAFSVCFLPVDELTKLIRRYASKSFGSTETQQNTDVVISLEGVTVPITSMLQAEGVNSVDQLIGMDPVLLAIRTGLPFKFVLNLISQAVVRRHIGEAASGLVPLDLSTCEQINAFIDRLDKEKKDASNQQIIEKNAQPAAEGAQATDPQGVAHLTACAAILQLAAKNINASLKDNKENPLEVNEDSLEQAFRRIKDDSFSKFLTTQ